MYLCKAACQLEDFMVQCQCLGLFALCAGDFSLCTFNRFQRSLNGFHSSLHADSSDVETQTLKEEGILENSMGLHRMESMVLLDVIQHKPTCGKGKKMHRVTKAAQNFN